MRYRQVSRECRLLSLCFATKTRFLMCKNVKDALEWGITILKFVIWVWKFIEGITVLKFVVWGGIIVLYTFANNVLRLLWRVAVKQNFRPYIRRYTSPNDSNFNTVIPSMNFQTENWLLPSSTTGQHFLFYSRFFFLRSITWTLSILFLIIILKMFSKSLKTLIYKLWLFQVFGISWARRTDMMHITQTCPCSILQYFTAVKFVNFQMKKMFVFFLIFAQNIDRGYTLESPHWGGSNEYPRSMFKSINE